MKKSIIISLAIATLAGCRGGDRQNASTPFVEEKVEYRPLVTDSAAIDSIINSGMIDDGKIMEVPDIPDDHEVNMDASDDDLIGIMSGATDDIKNE